MPRQARKRCETGIYHIVARGINRQNIFYHEDDYRRFMEITARMKTNNEFEIYGYCLMNNHFHLLLHEKNEEIAQTMRRIGTSYAWWHNQKYQRCGHLFQGRYRSECVEDDEYLLTVIRYIHKNPVKAGMVSKPEDYRWSSIQAYYEGQEFIRGFTETSFVFGILADDQVEARRRFREYMEINSDDKCLDDDIKTRKTDHEVKAEIEAMLNGEPVATLHIMEKKKRNDILRQVKLLHGATQRQIARVTGLNQNIIFKA